MLFLFLLGTCFASFTQVIADRYPNSPLSPKRSHCPNCQHVLVWRDLLPILSFVLLRGKCRYCHHKLPIYSPIMECLGGILWMYCYLNRSIPTHQFIHLLLLSIPLFLFAQIDLAHRIVPNTWLIIWGLCLTLHTCVIQHYHWHNLFYAIGLLCAYCLYDTCYPNKIGGADIKILACCMSYTSLHFTLLILVYACSVALVTIGLITVLKKQILTHIPFVPFLYIGTLLAHIALFFHN